MFITLIKIWAKRNFKQNSRKIVVGRYIDKSQPEQGRLSQSEVDRIFILTWRNLDKLLPFAHLEKLKTRGNRMNVFLAVASLAAYRAFRSLGFNKEYATELISDLGWKLYINMLKLPRFLAHLLYQDPQKQMNLMLKLWMRFPFSTPGYKRKSWEEENRFCIDWHRCPPFESIKNIGTDEEAEFFYNTWCTYDYAIAKEMVNGGHFERTKCLSKGDELCDMKWCGR